MAPSKGWGARDRLLTVARRRFAAEGTIAPTLDEVRREAEVSVGSLYHHFPDKPALAAAVYAQVMAEYQSGFVEMLRGQATAEDGIRGGVRHHLNWIAAHRGEAVLLLGDRLDSIALRAANQDFFAAIQDWWRPHRAYGVLAAIQPGVTAALWFGPAQEYARHWVAGGVAEMDSEVVEIFADAAWNALHTKRIEENS
ncbi:TetR/AcrR family transcriptional regulator [Mycobacterium sp. DL440]|uniref:TetR/AcrR family transcriptional regulator n=1 Tax=Mycobacterium sp. DL440 TaxID=2675523 RepID=UPI0014227346|nr:TetR/AcrR family transcriptional regulator [Mycobacterium sp. DL440]